MTTRTVDYYQRCYLNALALALSYEARGDSLAEGWRHDADFFLIRWGRAMSREASS